MDSQRIAHFFIVLGAILVLIAVYSGVTGYSLKNVSGNGEVNGDSVTLRANIDNVNNDRVSVWAIIWDNTGGMIWQGFMSLIGGENSTNEIWEVSVDTDSPPFPNISDDESFDYSIYVNYSDGEVESSSGSFVLDAETVNEEGKVRLKKGWNMVSFVTSDSEQKTGDRKVSLSKGWNLIGYSSDDVAKVNLEDVLVDGVSFTSAVEGGKVQSKFAYYDSEVGSYKVVSTEGKMQKNGAYWVYSNTAKEISFKGVGGDMVGTEIPVSELRFKNEKTGEVSLGVPVGVAIQEYDSETRTFKYVFDEVSSWKGYFVYSPNEDYSIVG